MICSALYSPCLQEDLDLLLFSDTSQQNFAAHGLPLKAVYREAAVGLRYQHPRVVPSGVTPVRSAMLADISSRLQ